MMNSKLIIIPIIILFILSSGNAIIFDEFTVMIDKLDQDISEITYLMVLSENGEQTISFNLVEEQEGLNVYNKKTSENLEYTLDGPNLTISVMLGDSEQRTIVVKSFSNNLVDVKNGENIISIKQDIPKDVSKFELILTLPEGMILSDVEDTNLVFPEPTSILSDGKKIILDWKETNPEDSFEIFVNYEQLDKGQPVLAYLTVMVIVLIVLVALVIFVRGNKKVNRVVSSGLSKEEKVIYNLIKSKKEISQKEVLNQLDYSKPRLSKLIRKLEEKELIDKKPKGRTNILKIKRI